MLRKWNPSNSMSVLMIVGVKVIFIQQLSNNIHCNFRTDSNTEHILLNIIGTVSALTEEDLLMYIFGVFLSKCF